MKLEMQPRKEGRPRKRRQGKRAKQGDYTTQPYVEAAGAAHPEGRSAV